MNNIKRIIAAGLVGTAVISTGVVASAAEVTYKEAAKEALLKAGMPENYVNDVVDACSKIVLDEEQAELLDEKISYTLTALDGKHMSDLTDKNSPIVSDLQEEVQKPIERNLNLSIVADQAKGLSIRKTDNKGNTLKGEENTLIVWTVDEVKELSKAVDKNALKDPSTIGAVKDLAKQEDKNAVKPAEPTPDPTPTPEPQPTPDPEPQPTPEPPTKGEATKTPGEATKTPDDETEGDTAKTATNFGNVALAGAGLMTVAGAVFVISKKKIC